MKQPLKKEKFILDTESLPFRLNYLSLEYF